MFRLRRLLFALILFSSVTLSAQQAPAPLNAEEEGRVRLAADLIPLVREQFGTNFELATAALTTNRYLTPTKEEREWRFFVTGDLDGDGTEDAVIVARSKSPLADESAFDYKVIDPFYEAHGYGDPKITAGFQTEDPRYANSVLLVIHGAGAEGWRAKKPKSKYVIINLQFSNISLGHHLLDKKKKKVVRAIQLAEESMFTQTVFWDGKKYKWMSASTPTELP